MMPSRKDCRRAQEDVLVKVDTAVRELSERSLLLQLCSKYSQSISHNIARVRFRGRFMIAYSS